MCKIAGKSWVLTKLRIVFLRTIFESQKRRKYQITQYEKERHEQGKFLSVKYFPRVITYLSTYFFTSVFDMLQFNFISREWLHICLLIFSLPFLICYNLMGEIFAREIFVNFAILGEVCEMSLAKLSLLCIRENISINI